MAQKTMDLAKKKTHSAFGSEWDAFGLSWPAPSRGVRSEKTSRPGKKQCNSEKLVSRPPPAGGVGSDTPHAKNMVGAKILSEMLQDFASFLRAKAAEYKGAVADLG